jgi:NHS family xanthosine MFS transporter
MMMTNGFGAFLGSWLSGIVIDTYFKISDVPGTIMFDWKGIWLTFAAYSLVVAILFAIFFRHKHDPKIFSAAPTH